MNIFFREAFYAFILMGFFSGCSSAITKKSPPIAHIHIGHTLTGWGATPDKKGLITTAEQESAIAMANAQKAASSVSLAEKKLYMANTLHALDPELQATGSGGGYGLNRALVESIAHIQYAATSPDASTNIRQTVPMIVSKAQKLSSNSNQLKIFAQAARDASSLSEANALINEFMKTSLPAKNGYSLAQFKGDITQMVSREQPPYTTVDAYYLFNLIRLPNGTWGFASDTNSSTSNSSGY